MYYFTQSLHQGPLHGCSASDLPYSSIILVEPPTMTKAIFTASLKGGTHIQRRRDAERLTTKSRRARRCCVCQGARLPNHSSAASRGGQVSSLVREELMSQATHTSSPRSRPARPPDPLVPRSEGGCDAVMHARAKRGWVYLRRGRR